MRMRFVQSTESNDLRVIAITASDGQNIICRSYNHKEKEILRKADFNLTAFGAGIPMAAAIFEVVIEAETEIGIAITLLSFM